MAPLAAPREDRTTLAQEAWADGLRALHRVLEEQFGTDVNTPPSADPKDRRGPFRPNRLTPVRSRLERKYGTRSVWRGGMKVYTTLDLKMQRIAEEVMEKGLAEFDAKAAKDWEAKLKEDAAEAEEGVEVSTTLPKIQGAFIVMDVKTGAVRAMIGGRDSKFNRAVQAYRQPGSTFKPFVWAAALNAGMTGAALIEDNPLAF